MRKKAFTVLEMLICLFVVSVSSLCCFSVLKLSANEVYDTTIARQQQKNVSTVLIYMSREIRSAKTLSVTDKQLKITPVEGTDIVYEITAQGLTYGGETVLKTAEAESGFASIENGVEITLTANNTKVKFTVYKRCK